MTSGGLPLDFVAVHGIGASHEAVHFRAGRALQAPAAGARFVLHAGSDRRTLGTFEASGALCVPAARLLALLDPESSVLGFQNAQDVGERYVRAAAALRPDAEVLRSAAALLPVPDQALGALLQRAVSEITVGSLAIDRAARAAPAVQAPSGDRATPFDWPRLEPHALLDRAFQHLHTWRRADGALPFEARPGQEDMAHAVLDAWLVSRSQAVEAGTGVGKTIAYALPMLVVAATHGGRFLVATHTRTLQHQLVDRDLPELWDCLGLGALGRPDGGTGLRFAKLLGRSNYVCRTALRRLARSAAQASAAERFDVARLLVWSLRTTTGELEEIAPVLESGIGEAIRSERESCEGRACRAEPACPVYAARDAARQADLVVVNHALLFSDAATDGSILGEFAGVVVDEAHHLEAVATEHLSVRVGRREADGVLPILGRFVSALRALPRGNALAIELDRHGAAVAALRQSLHAFLDRLGTNLPRPRRGRVGYRDGDEVFGGVRAELEALRGTLAEIATASEGLAGACMGEGGAATQDCAAALDLVTALARETEAALAFLAQGDDEDWAFALDFGADGAALREILASPLDVATEVHRLVNASGGGAALYTSATLAVSGSFDYWLERVGLRATTPCLVVPSPFDYPTQCLVAQATHLADYDAPEFEPQVAEILAGVAAGSQRRMLVLLTSHASLRRLDRALRARLGDGFPLFAQDIHGSRAALAARFRATPGAILLGTASFWEGVDFPGDILEVLAVVKLPFLVPDDPLVAARSERLRRRGENPFTDYMLPDAVLRFAQGFGRLVRTRHDRGVALLLDARLDRSGYRRRFLDAIPCAPETFDATPALVERAVGWLETHAPR